MKRFRNPNNIVQPEGNHATHDTKRLRNLNNIVQPKGKPDPRAAPLTLQVSEVSGLLQGLEWVVHDDVSHWGIDSRTIDLAFTVRGRGVGVGAGVGVLPILYWQITSGKETRERVRDKSAN